MQNIRNVPITSLLGEKVDYTDFAIGVNGLPKSNVLRFRNDKVNVVLRPSGTEPKLKIYLQIKSEDCNALNELKKELCWLMGK